MRDWPELVSLQPRFRRIARGDEDIVQATNLKLLEHRQRIRNLGAYGSCVAKRIAIDEGRRSSLQAVPLTEEVPDRGPTPLEAVCKAEVHQRMCEAILALPPRQRESIENPRGRANHSSRCKAKRALRRRLEAIDPRGRTKMG